MFNFAKSLAGASLGVVAMATVATGSTPAQAQASAKFSADDAAYCAATFGWILEFLAPNGLPEAAVVQSNIAFMMYNYELNVAMNGSDEGALKAKADAAIKKLSEAAPNRGGSQEEIQVLVDYVTGEASTCGKNLEAAYPNGKHPVLIAMQEQAALAAQQQATATPSAPAAAAPAPAPAPQQPAPIQFNSTTLPLVDDADSGSTLLDNNTIPLTSDLPLQ